MHVALTDVLTCPRCGPDHGLILLPDEVSDRRVVSGVLGCADCREQYHVVEGVADFTGGEDPVGVVETEGTREGAERLGGLLGLGAGSGVVFLAGPEAAHGAELAGLVEHVHVVATIPAAVPGVSPARVSDALPFQSVTLRGVALTGASAEPLLEEGARVVAPGGRLLLDPAPEDARPRLEAAGLRVMAEHEAALLATR